MYVMLFFFSSRRRHTRSLRDWSSDVCSSDLPHEVELRAGGDDVNACGGRVGPRLGDAGGELRNELRRPAADRHGERRLFQDRSEERRVGKSVDLGGRRMFKKKKSREEKTLDK